MTYDILGPGALDYLPCQYGASKLTFRGPMRALEAPYVAFIGGTQTFGKFIEQPYPLRVEHMTGVASVNFGQANAGLDVFAREPVVLDAARRANVAVVEVLGAVNMTNRLYSVHPRRNDRFLRASPQLRHLYPDVDFTHFHFTQHMLQHLHKTGPVRFAQVRRILQRVWLRRMRQLLAQCGEKVVLLRFGSDIPAGDWPEKAGIGPALVTDEMMKTLAAQVSDTVDVPLGSVAQQGQTRGMVFNLLEEEAAKALPGPQAHGDAARLLRPVLDGLM